MPEEIAYIIRLISNPINVVARSKEAALVSAEEWLKEMVADGEYEVFVEDWNEI